MADVLLKQPIDETDVYDLQIGEDGDFVMTDGLDTALDMSIFCEIRADESEIKNARQRGGWIGNEMFDILGFVGYQQGSKLWLAKQFRKTQQTLNICISYIEIGFKWLVSEKLAKKVVVNGFIEDYGFLIEVEITKPSGGLEKKEYKLWEKTNI